MQPDDVKEMLGNHFADAHIDVGGDGSHFEITIVSDHFEGLNRLKRQKSVYAALNERIADGSIHAVMMSTYTPAEWEQSQSNG
jgi:acid stress-induced BolA-like protein IbaG/YrbA